MYKNLLFLTFILFSLHLNAQTKKKAPVAKSKTTTTKPNTTKPKENKEEAPKVVLPEGINAGMAGKYAKDFAKKMHKKINVQPKKSDYTLSINKWKAVQLSVDGDAPWLYLIDITIKWQSGAEGWPTQWNNMEYKGVLTCTEFGCEPFFYIKEKDEVKGDFLGLFAEKSPVQELPQNLKEGLPRVNEMLEGVHWAWTPDGCLE